MGTNSRRGMYNMKHISIANDFSVYPAGRMIHDGPFSGEKFRKDFLEPVMKSNEQATIDLDGTRGYGSSFLEEAFGGLVREGYDANVVKQRITIVSSRGSLTNEINSYIDHALD